MGTAPTIYIESKRPEPQAVHYHIYSVVPVNLYLFTATFILRLNFVKVSCDPALHLLRIPLTSLSIVVFWVVTPCSFVGG